MSEQPTACRPARPAYLPNIRRCISPRAPSNISRTPHSTSMPPPRGMSQTKTKVRGNLLSPTQGHRVTLYRGNGSTCPSLPGARTKRRPGGETWGMPPVIGHWTVGMGRDQQVRPCFHGSTRRDTAITPNNETKQHVLFRQQGPPQQSTATPPRDTDREWW